MEIKKIIEKYKNIIILLGLVIFCYLLYLFINWLKTESTDNAYIKSDITYLAANVTGYIQKINFSENDLVKPGDVLIQINDIPYKAALKQAEASLASAQAASIINKQQQISNISSVKKLQADIASSKSSLETSQNAYERVSKLYSAKDVAKAQFEQATSDYQGKKAQYEAAQYALIATENSLEELKAQERQNDANITACEAKFLQAQYDLENTKITAPFTGQVGRKLAPLGSLVLNGSYITNLVSQERWIIANYKETQLTKIKIGQEVDITIDAYSGVIFKGKVASVSPASGSEFSLLPPDNATGNFTKIVQRIPVKIIFSDQDMVSKYVITPGMSVQTRIKVGF